MMKKFVVFNFVAVQFYKTNRMEKNKNNQTIPEQTATPSNQTTQEKTNRESEKFSDSETLSQRRDKEDGTIQDNQDPKDKTNTKHPKTQIRNVDSIEEDGESIEENDEWEGAEETIDENKSSDEIGNGTNQESEQRAFNSQPESKAENPYNKEGGL